MSLETYTDSTLANGVLLSVCHQLLWNVSLGMLLQIPDNVGPNCRGMDQQCFPFPILLRLTIEE